MCEASRAPVGVKPVVFGVTGHALAMGGILTVTADYRVGGEGAFKIGLNEVAIGMPVPSFAVELCRDRLAKKWFTRCVQHAELTSPDTAVEAGFPAIDRRRLRHVSSPHWRDGIPPFR